MSYQYLLIVNDKTSHVLKFTGRCGSLDGYVDIKKQKALEIIHEVRQAVLKWNHTAHEAGVSKSSREMIEHAFKRVSKEFGFET